MLGDGGDRATIDRAISLVPDADEVTRQLLIAELGGDVVGFATLVWIHQIQLPGPEAHVAELVVSPDLVQVDGRGAADVEAALRAAVYDQAQLVGAARIGGPGWGAIATVTPPVVRELPAGETSLAVPALRELRPRLPDDDAAVIARIDRIQRPQGYRLFAVLPAGGAPASAVAGFRRVSNLAWGDVLYIDDLVTRADARGRGFAVALLMAVDDEARRLGLGEVHLDSGHGPDRAVAHRTYLAHGYRISSHHFTHTLPER